MLRGGKPSLGQIFDRALSRFVPFEDFSFLGRGLRPARSLVEDAGPTARGPAVSRTGDLLDEPMTWAVQDVALGQSGKDQFARRVNIGAHEWTREVQGWNGLRGPVHLSIRRSIPMSGPLGNGSIEITSAGYYDGRLYRYPPHHVVVQIAPTWSSRSTGRRCARERARSMRPRMTYSLISSPTMID